MIGWLDVSCEKSQEWPSQILHTEMLSVVKRTYYAGQGFINKNYMDSSYSLGDKLIYSIFTNRWTVVFKCYKKEQEIFNITPRFVFYLDKIERPLSYRTTCHFHNQSHHVDPKCAA